MKKKVIDIYPPSEGKNKEERRFLEKEKGVSCNKKWIVPVIAVLFFFMGYFYYTSYRTEIVIYPITDDFQLEEEVLAKSSGSVESEEIRGIILQEKISDAREFPIEGRELVESKARGEINVCQEYSDSPVNFVEGTRFMSEEGKVFLAEGRVNLPGRQTNEGCSMVEVVAAEAGEEYNIPSDSKFALPGLQGGRLYSSVSGISFTIKEKGRSEEVPYLDDKAKNDAQEEMKADLLEKGKKALKEEHGEEYFIENDHQYSIDIVERKLKEEEGEDEKFYFQLNVSVKVMAISKEDINSFIGRQLPAGYTWRKETEDLKLDFSTISFEEGEAEILINFLAEIYEDIDKEDWKRQIAGFDFDDARRVLEEDVEVEKIEIKTRPFGLNKVASDVDRVRVIIEFDKS